jgi:carboxymethylenebutenolidase
LIVFVGFRDGKIAYERVYWDQASVLVQIGLLDSNTLPVVGSESARKVLDPTLPSNQLITRASQQK